MNTKYHIHKSTVTCPYCDKEQDFDSPPDEFNKQETNQCGYCDKFFTTVMEAVFSTYSDCEANKEEHVFKECHIPGFYLCENCEEVKRAVAKV